MIKKEVTTKCECLMREIESLGEDRKKLKLENEARREKRRRW